MSTSRLTFSVSPSSLNWGDPLTWTTFDCGKQRMADCPVPPFQMISEIAYARASCCRDAFVGIMGWLTVRISNRTIIHRLIKYCYIQWLSSSLSGCIDRRFNNIVFTMNFFPFGLMTRVGFSEVGWFERVWRRVRCCKEKYYSSYQVFGSFIAVESKRRARRTCAWIVMIIARIMGVVDEFVMVIP